MTPIDIAFGAMEASKDKDTARLAFFGRVAEAELSLVLDAVSGDSAKPRLFEVDGRSYTLAFDTELRMSEYCGQESHYLSASGRQLAQMLSGQDVGIALNFGAPSAYLLTPDMLDWLVETIGEAPEVDEDRPVAIHPPRVPEALIVALDAKLATLEGLAESAWLADLEYSGGRRTATIAFVGAHSFVESALAQAIDEAVKFSGVPVPLEVVFLHPTMPIFGPFTRQGLRYDLPKPSQPAVPGADPDKPPKLM